MYVFVGIDASSNFPYFLYLLIPTIPSDTYKIPTGYLHKIPTKYLQILKNKSVGIQYLHKISSSICRYLFVSVGTMHYECTM